MVDTSGASPGPVSSTTDLLVLHAVRLLGMADAPAAARRFSLDVDEAAEVLLDHQARGWVTWSEFAGRGGWSLTDAGRIADERMLADELDSAGARAQVLEIHAAFLPLNARFLRACTDWQVRPTRVDALAANDHTDWSWDDRVLDELGSLGRRLAPPAAQLAAVLVRLDGYSARYSSAFARVERGERSYVDGLGIDSCHAVWFELHEDLVATLGVQRGATG